MPFNIFPRAVGSGVAGPARAVGNCASSPSAPPLLPGEWGRRRERVATWGAPGQGTVGAEEGGKKKGKVCRRGGPWGERGEPPRPSRSQ